MPTFSSGFGLIVQIVASITYPAGFTLTQFPDDVDPLDFPSLDIKEAAMGLNGDLIAWSKAQAVKATISIIANSDDDNVIATLFENNRVGKGKRAIEDVITLAAVYPDGRTVTGTGGVILSGMPGNGIASAGRYKTKSYGFAFENIVRT